MPFWIQGWLEVTMDDPDASDAIWRGVVDLGVLIDTSDDFSELMFGLSKSYRSDQTKRKTSLFADRGLPKIQSAALANALEGHKQLAKDYGPGEIGGYTYVLLADVRSAMPPDLSLEKSDWKLVFDIAALLIASARHSARHSADQVRFTVWYNW